MSPAFAGVPRADGRPDASGRANSRRQTMFAKKTSTTANKPVGTRAKGAGKKADATPKELSALDAAAKVLADSKEPMTTRAMIEAMAEKGLWTSPGGATPHATLYSAILREINANGKEARLKKVERGQFA